MNAATASLMLCLLGAVPQATVEPLCAERMPCRVVQTHEAGQNEQGQPLRVYRLSLGWTDLETGARFAGDKFGPGPRKAEGTPAEGRCEATEWWLVSPGAPARLVLSVCDDYLGAVREETVQVDTNRLVYTRSGARRDDQWTLTRVLRLSPLRLVSEQERTRWSSASGEQREDSTLWDSETLRGELVRAASDCQPGERSLGARRLPYLPQVRPGQGYLEGGWKQVGLGSGKAACHLEASHTLLGKEQLGSPQDASLKAVLVGEDTLIVEVLDDKWTGPSDKWLHDDHLELWLAPLPPQELNSCAGKLTQEQKPVQWGIRILDGKVFPAHGAPRQPLQVERAELPGGKGYRLKVTLPRDFLGISVIYSDSDSGTRQESMLGTSPLKFGRPETLNPVRLVPPEEATCEVRGGQLTPVPGAPLGAEPSKAVLTAQ